MVSFISNIAEMYYKSKGSSDNGTIGGDDHGYKEFHVVENFVDML